MFTINGEEWAVHLVSPTHPKLYSENGLLSIGSCDADMKAIYINDTLDDKMIWKVLCHEITHAAMFSYNVFLTEDQEELLADLLATYGSEIITTTNRVFAKLKAFSSNK